MLHEKKKRSRPLSAESSMSNSPTRKQFGINLNSSPMHEPEEDMDFHGESQGFFNKVGNWIGFESGKNAQDD